MVLGQGNGKYSPDLPPLLKKLARAAYDVKPTSFFLAFFLKKQAVLFYQTIEIDVTPFIVRYKYRLFIFKTNGVFLYARHHKGTKFDGRFFLPRTRSASVP